jgi:cell wall-associated NlpC family hydrolase/peptidoglycan hydrolase CwlO-like protein
LFVFLGLAIALVFVTGISAGAEPDDGIRAKKADIAAAQDRLTEIRMEAGSAEAAYNNALYEMNQLNGQITRTTEELEVAKERLAVAKKTMEQQATQVYKSADVAFMDVLVGVDNFSEFASRLNLWVRLLDKERAEFLEVREARNELAARRDRLEAQREQRVAAVETAIAQRERANEAEARASGYLDSLDAELRGAIRAAQDRQAARARAAAAVMAEKAQEPVGEPEPIPEVQVSQVKQAGVPRADLQSERAAAERKAAAQATAERADRLAEKRAAERKAARNAAEQAAAERKAARLAAEKVARQEAREEAERQAELAARRAAKRQAAREEAERRAEQAARRAEIEEAAAEQAAAEREAARLAAERRAERRAEQRAADRRAEERAAERAEASASASAAAEEEAAAERRTERRAKERAEASASASASVSSSKDSERGGGGRGEGASSASATASASASGTPAGGGGGRVSGLGADVLAVADDHLGTPYEFSPPGPCVAFEAEDCSCFTMLVFQEFGIALPDSPGGQMGYGTPVHGAPQAGDLLFWSEDGSGYITHVGIAMGDGTTIHAQVHNEVTITGINYIAGYVGARRLL